MIEKLLEKFGSIILQRSIDVTDAIVTSMVNQYENDAQVPFVYEKLKIIGKISKGSQAGTSSIARLLKAFDQMIEQPAHLHFMVNYPNPIRMYVMLLKTFNAIKLTIATLDESFKQTEEMYTKLILKIIDTVDPPGVLRCWLFSEVDTHYRVIDYLSKLKCFEILEHPKVVQIVGIVWKGIFEVTEERSIRSKLKNTPAVQVLRPYNVSVDELLSVCMPKRWLNCFTYLGKGMIDATDQQIDVLKQSYSPTINFKKRELRKARFLSYASFKESVSLLWFFDTVLSVVHFALIILIATLMTSSQVRMDTEYGKVQELLDEAQSSDVTARLNAKYNDLEEVGYMWVSESYTLISLITASICYFCKDVLIYISTLLRKVQIKSTTFEWMVWLDFLMVAFVIILLSTFNSIEYEELDNYKKELRDYQLMLYYRDSKPDIVTTYLIIMSLLFLRIVMSLVYSDMFGNFVQISLKMLAESLKFLVGFAGVIVFFAIMGYMLFNDLESYKDPYQAIISVFGHSLGDFDFMIYDESNLTGAFTGKCYLIIYLIISAILLLNFLIAIMTGTYENYHNYNNSLKIAEIVQLRTIYEYNLHYQCLVKCPILFCIPVLVLSPVIIWAKSKRLNFFLVTVEATIVIVISKTVLFSTYPFMFSFIAFVSAFAKLRWIYDKAEGCKDILWRILDLVIFIILSPLWVVC